VRIPKPPSDSAAEFHEALELWVKRVRITFWDQRRIAQYEHVHAYDYETHEAEGDSGYSGEERVTDRRLR
jgi:hypothetical protein